ncbi:MAG: DUF2064 domain-containing protein [Campylobacteraceae bacterium]|nr:DUF2064 domain-containing protein [Campylobacteraceae bacterium]
MKKNCLIFFTKSPELGRCKTRLNDFLSLEEARDLQVHLLNKNFEIVKKFNYLIFYDGDLEILKNSLSKDEKNEIPTYLFKKQSGENIGEKMQNAFKEVFALGYKKAVLIGSDLDDLKSSDIKTAFKNLDKFDSVFAPSSDGGYSLIGLKFMIDDIFDIKFSTKNVMKNTIKALKNHSYFLCREIKDIDTKFDIIAKFTKSSEISHLASGEYNSNFIFKDGSKKRIFRVNHASQMELDEQISYEYKALKILESSGVTPKVYKLFEKSPYLPNGALTMEFLKGKSLDYKKDMKKAAFILAKIHTHKIPKKHSLIVAQKPFLEMYKECKKMSEIYLKNELRQENVAKFLEFAFKTCESLGLESEISNKAIVNTELNSSNFIIGKKHSYLIDWEKPLISDKEQDLGHFLAPTTTFFKTDVILEFDEIEKFLDEYEKLSKCERNLVYKYIKFNCLRGVSWCAMASVSHQNTNAPTNPKIALYLENEFLDRVKKFMEKK